MQSQRLPASKHQGASFKAQRSQPRRQVNTAAVRATTNVNRQQQRTGHGQRQYQHRQIISSAAVAVGATVSTAADTALGAWLQQKDVCLSDVALQQRENGVDVLTASRDIQSGEAILEISGDVCITSADVAAEPIISAMAAGRGELTGLALWLIAERQKGATSPWAPFLQSLPQRVSTPLLWDDAKLQQLLRGSPVLPVSKQRAADLRKEWKSISAAAAEANTPVPAGVFSEQSFLEAMSVVLAHAIYLPAAQCFALVPVAPCMQRSGSGAAASIDYNADTGNVVLTASRSYRSGDEVMLYDGRPNGELFMATGRAQAQNPADYLSTEASLVAADRLYSIKKEILDSLGFANPQEFPMTVDGFPVQMLAYLRMARIQNSAELAKVSFEVDQIVSPANEYEVLQLLLADCRDRLSAYADNAESDLKALQNPDMEADERAATQLRLEEKRIVSGAMDAVRTRLAPIRGIPTKSGNLQDPNSDLREIFDTIESIPNIPNKIVEGFRSWARGDQDPDWKKGKR